MFPQRPLIRLNRLVTTNLRLWAVYFPEIFRPYVKMRFQTTITSLSCNVFIYLHEIHEEGQRLCRYWQFREDGLFWLYREDGRQMSQSEITATCSFWALDSTCDASASRRRLERCWKGVFICPYTGLARMNGKYICFSILYFVICCNAWYELRQLPSSVRTPSKSETRSIRFPLEPLFPEDDSPVAWGQCKGVSYCSVVRLPGYHRYGRLFWGRVLDEVGDSRSLIRKWSVLRASVFLILLNYTKQ